MSDELVFEVETPLGFKVKLTRSYWRIIITIKHPIMRGSEQKVKEALQYPEQIRRSRSDSKVYMF